MNNIAIVWDFDGTLTPDDSTTRTIEIITGEDGKEFWEFIKALRGDDKLEEWEHVLAMDAPIWMYSLARIAAIKKVPLNAEFFREFVVSEIDLFPNVIEFLQEIKNLEKTEAFSKNKINIHHFIVSAGLKELIEQVFPESLISFTYGCRFTVIAVNENTAEPESIPVFCMDETAKTRAIIEISKGSFQEEKRHVNHYVPEKWVEFPNMIYVGDGFSDIPALSLTRDRGGTGIVVFDDKKPVEKINEKMKAIRKGKRSDLITSADFSIDGELFNFIKTKCKQIRHRIEAQ
jgi:2-hydroxy-3-keto-5-methylthiopentenyl-1-phosphate phosphatase